MDNKNLALSVTNGIARICIDIVDNGMNTLSPPILDDFEELLDTLEERSDLLGAIVVSGKPDVFIAGADINVIASSRKAEDGEMLIDAAQMAFNRLTNLPVPVVAAVNGAALGGGYELVLACDAIVATDNPSTKLGLPEVMLGVLPGAGGCQRLPRRSGLVDSLDLLLNGKQVNAKKALKLGMVDDVVSPSVLEYAATKWVKKLSNGGHRPNRKLSLLNRLLQNNPMGRSIVLKQARAKVAKQTKGKYPAPPYIIDCVETGLKHGMKAGFAEEKRLFGKLSVSPESKALVSLFFAGNALKKDQLTAEGMGQPITLVGIVGSGLMGAGIASVSINQAKSNVRIKDVSDDGLRNALKNLYQDWQRRVERKSMTQTTARSRKNMVTTTLDYSGFEKTDLIIEAVFENLDLKQQLLNEIEKLPNAKQRVFASNTSSLRIQDIAKGASFPENIIGMHYFSPVEKMPLLEVVPHSGTSHAVIAKCVNYGRKQGKTVIVVKDGAGFYINRILGPYVNEAAHLLAEGIPFDLIDKTMVNWGLPVGPFKLLDEVGIDVVSKVQPNLEKEFGDRMTSVGILEQLLADNRLGKKNQRGFYQYGNKNNEPDTSIYSLLALQPKDTTNKKKIADRCTLMMLNEAVLSLEDETISCARDGDIGAVYGVGFPPFIGGPFRTIDSIGAKTVVERMRHYREQLGSRFTPAKKLEEMAKAGTKFYSDTIVTEK